jgi:hypothetical protein
MREAIFRELHTPDMVWTVDHSKTYMPEAYFTLMCEISMSSKDETQITLEWPTGYLLEATYLGEPMGTTK